MNVKAVHCLQFCVREQCSYVSITIFENSMLPQLQGDMLFLLLLLFLIIAQNKSNVEWCLHDPLVASYPSQTNISAFFRSLTFKTQFLSIILDTLWKIIVIETVFPSENAIF
jgi:hypothetical protein